MVSINDVTGLANFPRRGSGSVLGTRSFTYMCNLPYICISTILKHGIMFFYWYLQLSGVLEF